MTKPTAAFLWADNPTTLRTEPPSATQDTGFSVNTKLPAQYFNWLLGLCGDWVTWLNTRLFDAYTVPTDGSDCRIYGDPDAGITVKNEAATLLPVNCGQPIDNAVDQAVNVAYLSTCLCNFIGFEHDYAGSPLEITNTNKTYIPFSSYTPTITGHGITVNSTALECDEIGIYNVNVAIRWVNGTASPYARSVIIDVGGTEHTSFLMNEVSGAVARTQQYSIDVEVANIATDVIKVAAYQASGSSDYVQVVNVSVTQVGKRLV